MMIFRSPGRLLQRRSGQPEKVRGMNASLILAAKPGPLMERPPDRRVGNRRRIAWAAILAVVGVIAGLYTVDAVNSAATAFPAVVTTSKVYDLNFAGSGKVASLLVGVGQKVRAGQVLARQDTTALGAQLAAVQSVVKADQQAVSQYEAPQLSSAQRQQDALQVQQGQTALGNARTALASAEASGTSAVSAAQAAVSNAGQVAAGDQALYTGACPGGPVPPAADLVGAALQQAQSAFAHCQDLQLQMDRDVAAYQQAQAQIPVVESQAQAAINQAQATVNSAQATLNLTEYQQTLQTSANDPVGAAQAQAQLSQAESQLAVARQAVADATLTAPDSGTVAEVYGAVGEYVGPDGVHQYQAPAALPAPEPAQFQLFPSQSSAVGGSGAAGGYQPLIEIISGQQQVMAQVPENQVSGLRQGRAVQVDVGALHTNVTGRVSSVVLNATRSISAVTYDVVVTLDRTVPGLLPGMSATVRA